MKRPSSPPSFPGFRGTQRSLGALLALKRLNTVIFAIAALILGTTSFAATPKPSPQTPPSASRSEVSEKQGDLKELRGQIDSLRKEINETEGKRASAADQLKGVELEISSTQRDLRSLTDKRGKLQESLKELVQQARELENRLNNQQAQLEKLVYRQYLRGNPDALQTLLNGDNPNQVARDLHYLAAVGKARSQLLHEIEGTLQRKQALTATTQERAEELKAVEARQREQHSKLLAQREQRKLMLEKISTKITEQRREIGSLQRDEKRLTQVIERLAKILAAKAKVVAPQKEARVEKESRTTPTRPSSHEIVNNSTPEATTSKGLAQQKGSLRLPLKGTVTNRFGSARQEGSSWKGLFIRATPGTEVHSIAGGQVVFADWMRGFGNLMIVDHGDGYLSVYGNNDALLKQVGDHLRGGEVIASAGNSGGNPESGLYFELRHNGQPLDPLKWVSLR